VKREITLDGQHYPSRSIAGWLDSQQPGIDHDFLEGVGSRGHGRESENTPS
jgi:hypothetical protein